MSESLDYLASVVRDIRDVMQQHDANTPCAIFKPKFGVDGNMFYFLLGGNLQDGIAGFGETPYKAMCDFNKNFFEFKLK